jgi:hypothetical protein
MFTFDVVLAGEVVVVVVVAAARNARVAVERGNAAAACGEGSAWWGSERMASEATAPTGHL